MPPIGPAAATSPSLIGPERGVRRAQSGSRAPAALVQPRWDREGCEKSKNNGSPQGFKTTEQQLKSDKDSARADDMILAAYLSFFLIFSSVGAAKNAGDDDWVHLPNKCEGNGSS